MKEYVAERSINVSITNANRNWNKLTGLTSCEDNLRDWSTRDNSEDLSVYPKDGIKSMTCDHKEG